jgi:hypothetical protein
MPLSEHEQQMLDEMERLLFADDPKLARAFREPAQPRHDSRRIVVGLVGVGVGLALLVLSVSLSAIALGVLAFVVMLAGAIWAVTAPRKKQGGTDTPATPPTDRDPSGGDFMRRMEERWEKRSGEDPRR